jgi:hypothetical protein
MLCRSAQASSSRGRRSVHECCPARTRSRNACSAGSCSYFPPRQRFSVTPNAGGGSAITLDENETVSIGTDAEGAVTITVNPKPPENGNGNGNGARRLPARRGLFGRAHDKMAVSTNSDGSILIRPEGDASLQLVGDPLSGAVTVVEIVPEPLNTPAP